MPSDTSIKMWHTIQHLRKNLKLVANSGKQLIHTQLHSMHESDFEIRTYQDKNRAITRDIETIGWNLLDQDLYSLAEEYWRQIDSEICLFNNENAFGVRVNRGIPLGNIGVAQIAQNKTALGLHNLYCAYVDDNECLGMINEDANPERDIAHGILYLQFEERLVASLYQTVVSRFSSVFHAPIHENELTAFMRGFKPDSKLLLYTVLHRFLSALSLERSRTTFISRTELLRSMSDFGVWIERELKARGLSNSRELGGILGDIITQKYHIKLNPVSGQYTDSNTLTELQAKIGDSLNTVDPREVQHARIVCAVRNFVGHNLEVDEHALFSSCDELLARMLSFSMFARDQGWIN